jgi:hypothetical protein
MIFPYGSQVPDEYILSSGEISPGGFRHYRQRLQDAGFNAEWVANLRLEPGGWAQLESGEYYHNTTDEVQYYNISGVVAGEAADFEIAFGADATNLDAINVGFVQFTSIRPNVLLFNEPFDSLVSLDMGDADAEQPSGSIETPSYLWNLSYLTNRDEGFVIDMDSGLVLTLNRSEFYSGRGVRLEPDFMVEDQSVGIKAVLALSTELVDGLEPGNNEGGYWGFWVIGANEACLWINCAPEQEGGPFLPQQTPYGSNEYDYIQAGPGPQSIDLSQFDETLGGQILHLAFEAYIHPLVG